MQQFPALPPSGSSSSDPAPSVLELPEHFDKSKMLAVSAVSASAALVSQPLASRRHGAERCAVRMGEPPKIVVTGVGTVTAVGSGDEFWSNLIGGVSGVDTISAFDASKFPTTIGAECKDFNAKDHFSNPKNVKATDRYTHLAVAASRMAVDDAGLDLDKVEKRRFGVVVGSAFGGMDTFEKQVLQLARARRPYPYPNAPPLPLTPYP